MFNNKFLKNDPLLEAVKAARADGDARRLAESMANDLFGVFSRKAVIREHLSDYDFALEEAYKCLSMKEEDKMATRDWDGDKKIETEKKEIWGRRLRKAKEAGKYHGPVDEKKMWEAEDSSDGLPPSAAAKQAAKQTSTPASTPAPTKTKDLSSTFSSARGATGMQEAQINELSRTTLKSYVKKANRQANDLERKVNTRKDKPGEEDKMYRRIDGVNLAHDKMKVRVAATNEEALDEISKELAGRYIKKASRDALQHGAGYAGSGGDYKHLRKGANRVRGIEKAVDRLAKEETQIDEATRKHFRQHAADIAKISDQGERNKAASAAADTYARLNPRFDHAKFHKAAGSTAHETQTMKESVIASLLEKYSFKSAQVIEANAFDLGKTVPDAAMKIRGGAYPSFAARVKDMAGITGRGLAKGFFNPVTAGALIAAEPTPANSGENEFARQAKYAPKATPASAGRTGVGMNKAMNRGNVDNSEIGGMGSRAAADSSARPASTPAPKPAAAPASAPAPVPQTAMTNKAGYYKGGSMGDTTVKRGDTLSGIAKRTGQSVSDLAKMNNISDVNKISSGAKLMTKVPTPPSRPADSSSAPTPAPASTTTKMMKTSPAYNSSDIARSVAKTPYGSTQSVATSLATVGSKPAQASGSDITDKATYDTKTTKPAPFQSGPSSVKLPSEPEKFSGSAEGPAPVAKPAAPAPAEKPPEKKKEAGAVPAAPMAECVQIGANKYRIV